MTQSNGIASRWRVVLLSLAALVSSTLIVRAAKGEESPEAEARTLFREGNSRVEQGDYPQALERFRAAYRLWKNPKIQLNMATVLRELGRPAEAANAYQHYLREAEPPPEKRQEVELVVQELEGQLGRVSLAVDEQVTRVWLDGELLDPGEYSIHFVEPGAHRFRLESANGSHDTVPLVVSAGERRKVTLASALPSEGEPQPPPASRPTVPSPNREKQKPSCLGVVGRVDLDGQGRGAVGGLGAVWALNSHFRLTGGALLGVRQGAWVGASVALFRGPLRPILGLSMPTFFVGTVQPGISGELGLRGEITNRVAALAQVALVHFPLATASYIPTVVVPSVGLEVRL